MPTTAAALLPLKPLIFQILLGLSEGERHGWDLVREIQRQTGGDRLLPANFYRTLRSMVADGLIAETEPRRADPDLERRRYFALTPLGREAARLEAKRLTDLVAQARTRRLAGGRTGR